MKKQLIAAALMALFSATAAFADQLTILKAVYAGGDVQRDVTPLLAKNVKDGQLLFQVGNQVLGGDPFFGKVKTLTVVYRNESGDFTITVREGARLILPNSQAIPVAPSSQTAVTSAPVIPAALSQSSPTNIPQTSSITVSSQRMTLPLAGEDFTTLDGDKYTNATVKKIEPDGIVVADTDGVRKLKFKNLPPETQQKFGYNPEKAAQYQKQIIVEEIASQKARANWENDTIIVKTLVDAARAESVERNQAEENSQKSSWFGFRITQPLQDGSLGILIPESSYGGDLVYVSSVTGRPGEEMSFEGIQNGVYEYTTTTGTIQTVKELQAVAVKYH